MVQIERPFREPAIKRIVVWQSQTSFGELLCRVCDQQLLFVAPVDSPGADGGGDDGAPIAECFENLDSRARARAQRS